MQKTKYTSIGNFQINVTQEFTLDRCEAGLYDRHAVYRYLHIFRSQVHTGKMHANRNLRKLMSLLNLCMLKYMLCHCLSRKWNSRLTNYQADKIAKT